MKRTINMMAIVRKSYDVDPSDEDAMAKAKEDFDKQKVSDLAFHYFPLEDEVDL